MRGSLLGVFILMTQIDVATAGVTKVKEEDLKPAVFFMNNLAILMMLAAL